MIGSVLILSLHHVRMQSSQAQREKQGEMFQKAFTSISTRMEDHVSDENFPLALYEQLDINTDDRPKLSQFLKKRGHLYGLDKQTLVDAGVTQFTITQLCNFLRQYKLELQ